jgi:hypothetical protein
MATTDRAMASRALEVLRSVVPSSALLHGAGRLVGVEPLSDLDVAVDGLSKDWHRHLVSALAEAGLSPLIVWPYDSGAVSIFLVTAGLADGVQLDLLCTPQGQGRYGFRSTVALSEVIKSNPIDNLSPVDTWLYEVQKRWMKGQEGGLHGLLNNPPAPSEKLLRRVKFLFSDKHASLVSGLLVGTDPVVPGRPWIRDVPRIARRLTRPAGIWVHSRSQDSACAVELEDRLARVLPLTTVLAWPSQDAVGRVRGARLIARHRWRAGVAVTYGPRKSAADCEVQSTDPQAAAERLRLFSAERALNHLAQLRWSTSD